MNPIRKTIPAHIVALVTVIQNACETPLAVIATAPISVMPRFSRRSPALAHTTIAKTMTSVLILSLLSLPIVCFELIVSGYRRCFRHADHRLRGIAALPNPLPAFRTQLQEARRLVIQAFALVA